MWQIASDFVIFLGWFFQNLGDLLVAIFLPIKYIFTFIKGFFERAFTSPVPAENIWQFNGETLAIFNAIPYWTEMLAMLSVAILLIFGFFILKTFLKT